jgi:hypothetical protein
MDEIYRYLVLARSTSASEFVEQSDATFLLKRPRRGATTPSAPPMISYETRLTKLEVDPYASEWRVVPVKKREGNPYPDRISVGRATNCDIVIRLPSISKVHAHILGSGPGSYKLVDNGASNATFVNGRRVESKAAVPIQVGDTISLGSLELEFVDAERLYQILRSEVDASKSPGLRSKR